MRSARGAADLPLRGTAKGNGSSGGSPQDGHTMNQVTTAALASWQNFYVILGSAAGALTGLQFVVMTLVMQARSASNARDIQAFGTPTVMQFCTALLVSALMTAPWPTPARLGACLGACGVAGVTYSVRIIWHARKAEYEPDLEDRIWYIVLPLLGHAALAAGAGLIWCNVPWSPVVIAADALVFLFVGVHNSWDTVTFIAVRHAKRSSDGEGDGAPRT